MNCKAPRLIALFRSLLTTLLLFINCDRPVASINPDPENPAWREERLSSSGRRHLQPHRRASSWRRLSVGIFFEPFLAAFP